MRVISNSRRLHDLRLRLCAVLIAAFGMLGVVASPATADYTVVQCIPGSQGYAEAAWTPFGSTGFSVWGTNECAVGYGLRLDTNYNGAGTGWTGNGSGLAWRFTAPYATSFSSASASLHYGDNGGYAAAYFSDGSPDFAVPDGGDGATSLWTTASVSNAHIFEIRLQCFAYPNCHSNWSYVWATQFVGVMRDESGPAVSADGPLLAGGVVHGVKTLDATATDAGGGARSISVYVNGLLSQQADFCPPDYQGAYTHLVPCSGSFTQQFVVDTERDPGWVDGANEVEICATDVGGNGSGCVTRTVMADNSCPGSGGAGASTLDSGAQVRGKLTDRAVIRSTDQAVIRGTLRDKDGDPVQDATVCVYQTVDLPDASRELVAKVTTQSNGRFATVLDPGPSRKLDLVYRYNDKILDDRVELDSRVVPTLKVPRRKRSVHNGEATRFKGRLPGPNADGRAVALQARAGRKWRTFKQLRTGPDGRFHGKYRFVHTRGRQLYLFRVLVKSQGGYPYEPGHSHKQKVIVRG
jgi:5-hydroxyisourate hydrolase-like protein (transthyretin family)